MLLESSDSTLDDTRTTIGEADKPVKDGVGRIGLVIVLGVAFLLIFSAFNVVQVIILGRSNQIPFVLNSSGIACW